MYIGDQMISVSGIPSSDIISSRDLPPALSRTVVADNKTNEDRPASGKNIDTSSLNKAFTFLCPQSPWVDSNKNNRVELNELSYVNASTLDIFNVLDVDSNGISLDEIRSYSSPDSVVDINMDTSVIYQALKNSGCYRLANVPVEFITSDKLPEEVKKLAVYKTLPKMLGDGKLVTLAFSETEGHIGRSTTRGSDKLCLVVVPCDTLEYDTKENFQWLITHELIHARQYLSGKRIEFFSLSKFMNRIGKFDESYSNETAEKAALSLCEIEAWKINLKNALSSKDHSSVNYFIKNINRELDSVRAVLEDLKLKGAVELCPLLKSMLDDVMTDEEAKWLSAATCEQANSNKVILMP